MYPSQFSNTANKSKSHRTEFFAKVFNLGEFEGLLDELKAVLKMGVVVWGLRRGRILWILAFIRRI